MKDSKTREALVTLANLLGFRVKEGRKDMYFSYSEGNNNTPIGKVRFLELQRNFYLLLDYLEVKIENKEIVVVKKKKNI